MSKEIVHMRINTDLRNQVKELADSDYDGVFTAAMESLINQALNMRSIDESKRWAMYSAAKNIEHQSSDKDHMQFVRAVIDGLNL